MKNKANSSAKSPSIAVVGMGCVYPGAHSPDELWENVLAGRRFFRKAPMERLPSEYFDLDPDATDKSYCDRMAVITGWEFDPLKFRIPPVTANVSDVAHWLALYTADAALQDSGLDLVTIDRTRAGIMLGNTLGGEFNRAHNLRLRWPYAERALNRSLEAQGLDKESIGRAIAVFHESFVAPFPESTEDSLAGNMSNTIAGRICNHFDLGGGGFTVDGACSSALLGVVLACDALVKGDLDFALAGGVDVSLDPFEIVGFAKTKALTRDDIRPYDERADGMMTGEGCGIFVLMREADARDRALRIHALLKGWAYSSDGKGGITAPEVDGQARALRLTYERAGYPMASIGLIEGHGTGTPVGDKVELTAIQRELASSGEDFHCAIGSVKANIGHCKAAAGAAGLIKAIQSVKHKIIPPTVNCERPTNTFSQSDWKLRPSLLGRAWESNGAPRRASVSSMGFGGANSHVTLEEASPGGTAASQNLDLIGSAQSSELIVLAASSIDDLRLQVDHLLPISQRICHAELTDLAAELAVRMPVGDYRLGIVADAPWRLAELLQLVWRQLSAGMKLSAIDAPTEGIFAGEAMHHPSFVALFPGQGSQRLNMGERLLERYPFIRDLYTNVDENVVSRMFRETLGSPLSQVQDWESQLKATQIAQPAIVAASTAALQVLKLFGLRPTMSIGHSLGEITALHAAGAFDAATAVTLAAHRGQAMNSLNVDDPGSMIAMAATSEYVETLIKPYGEALVISNYNSTRQTVVSGTTESVVKLREICQAKNIRCQQLPVSHAFHSDIVAPATTAFADSLTSVQFATITGQVVSTTTGGDLPAYIDLKDLLANQIRRPVRFVDAVRFAAETKPAMWIEIGPGGTLTSFVRDILGSDSAQCFPTDLANEDCFHLLNEVLARAFVLGFPVATERLFAHRFHRPFGLDNYDPIFITNPCERPIHLTSPVEPIVSSLPSGLLPVATDPSILAAYLAERGDFIRDMIALDFHYNSSENTHERIKRTEPAHEETHQSPELIKEIASDYDSTLKFAVDWIVKRTGFPSSVVTSDKRLRDELNLDSIKVGELVILMAKKANRTFHVDPAAYSNATIQELVESLLDHNQSHSTTDAATATLRRISLQAVESLGGWVRTFNIASATAPIDAEPLLSLPSSGSIVIIGDTGSPYVGALAELVQSNGLTPVIADGQNLPVVPENVAALIVLLPSVEIDFIACSPVQFDHRVEGLATQLYSVFRWILPAGTALRATVVRPYTDNLDVGADFDAGSAFLKSLWLETPNSNLKWLVLPEEWSVEQFAATAIMELKRSGTIGVRYLPTGERTCEVAKAATGAPTPLPLGPDDVALVSGGGKGITFELALELALQTGCKLAIIGSSPPPDPHTSPARNELTRNLDRLQATGVVHAYYQADVTDLDAVCHAAASAAEQLGKITAVFHGAGVAELRSLRDKPLDEFLSCIRIKTRGLYNLLSAVSPHGLKALHVISSVLGNSGMRGQTDYTFANAWLDETVRQIQFAYPSMHCLSLGYSVWEGTGLGERLGALELLRSAGVTPITMEEGVAAYLQLLRTDSSGPRHIVTGRLTTDLESNLYQAPNLKPHRFLERLLRWVPGTELVADSSLSHGTDLYFPEHVFEGTPMFPGVMALEAMTQAATECAGIDELPVFRNIVFSRPLIVPEDATVLCRTLALTDVSDGNGLCVRVAIRSDADDFQQSHFEAECWFGLPEPMPEAFDLSAELLEPLDINPEDFSPVPLFQGKLFRRIVAIRKLEAHAESRTDVLVPEGDRYFSAEQSQSIATLSPAARDAFLQSAALVGPYGSLPERISEWRVFRRWQAGEHLRCHATVWSEDDKVFGADIDIRNTAGELVERIVGARFRHSK